ncbi:MAG: hypothetical protein GY754_45350 [bacterium]|nr:hypothetical protein [bacterium]
MRKKSFSVAILFLLVTLIFSVAFAENYPNDNPNQAKIKESDWQVVKAKRATVASLEDAGVLPGGKITVQMTKKVFGTTTKKLKGNATQVMTKLAAIIPAYSHETTRNLFYKIVSRGQVDCQSTLIARGIVPGRGVMDSKNYGGHFVYTRIITKEITRPVFVSGLVGGESEILLLFKALPLTTEKLVVVNKSDGKGAVEKATEQLNANKKTRFKAMLGQYSDMLESFRMNHEVGISRGISLKYLQCIIVKRLKTKKSAGAIKREIVQYLKGHKIVRKTAKDRMLRGSIPVKGTTLYKSLKGQINRNPKDIIFVVEKNVKRSDILGMGL